MATTTSLSEITCTYNAPLRFRPEPTIWPVGAVKRVVDEEGRVIGYRMDPDEVEYINGLPVEFFNHQVADLDLEDEEAIFAFVTKWGFPFTPSGVGYEVFGADALEDKYLSDEELPDTQTVWEKCGLKVGYYPDSAKGEQRYPYGQEAYAISLREVRISLAMVRELRRLLFESIMNGEDECFWERESYLGAAEQQPWTVPEITIAEQGLPSLGFLTQAIANQIRASLLDDTEWRECVTCHRLFQYKQSKKKLDDRGKKRKDSFYCSTFCQENRHSTEA